MNLEFLRGIASVQCLHFHLLLSICVNTVGKCISITLLVSMVQLLLFFFVVFYIKQALAGIDDDPIASMSYFL